MGREGKWGREGGRGVGREGMGLGGRMVGREGKLGREGRQGGG